MHAPLPVPQNQSHISICFGQKITSQKNPFQLDLELEFFSQKNQKNRLKLQEVLGFKIDDATIVIQIIAKNGVGAQIAEKTMNFLKESQDYKKQNKYKKKLQIKAFGKGEICYLLIISAQFKDAWSDIKEFVNDVKNLLPDIQKATNLIKLQIKSLNSCDYVRKLLDNQGISRAFLDSLDIELNFQKTKLIQTVLIKAFVQNQILSLIGPLKACKKLNLNLNFSSSSEQDRYQNLRNCFKKQGEKESFGFFKHIKGLYNQQMRLRLFHPIFSIQGKCVAENAASLIDAFFD